MSVNRVATIFGLELWITKALCNSINPQINLSAAFMGNNGSDEISTIS